LTRINPSVTRALRILELFLHNQNPLSIPTISDRLGPPRTTTHELVNTLIHTGYLRRDSKQPNKVFLRPSVFQLGNVYEGQLDLITEAGRIAWEIVAKCDETV
jgi:DNA-binding IclR family transcriptional regulator